MIPTLELLSSLTAKDTARQLDAVQTIFQMFLSNQPDSLKRESLKAGCFRAVLSAIPASALTVQAVQLVTDAFSAMSQMVKHDHTAASGDVSGILQKIRIYQDSPNHQVEATGLLWLLSNVEQRAVYVDQLRANGAIELVIFLIKRHSSSPEVLANCFGALAGLTRDSEVVAAIAEANGLLICVNALKNSQLDLLAASAACQLIAGLSTNSHNCSLLVEAGAFQLVLKVLQRATESSRPCVAACACAALWPMVVATEQPEEQVVIALSLLTQALESNTQSLELLFQGFRVIANLVASSNDGAVQNYASIMQLISECWKLHHNPSIELKEILHHTQLRLVWCSMEPNIEAHQLQMVAQHLSSQTSS